MIPGSSLKGIAAHFAHDVLGEAAPEFRREGSIHNVLFGTTNEGGLIDFLDAWWDAKASGSQGGLITDVLTPHHPSSSSDESGDWQPPTDFDGPTPVSFLAVCGVFLVAVTSSVPDQTNSWAKTALDVLTLALGNWGTGGKTRAGYGRMKPIDGN